MVTPLPLDLARHVIEYAASADWSLQTTTTLSLVSKEVQTWADRYLFRDIIIQHAIIPRKIEKFMNDFTQDNPTDRFKRAALHVRTFTTKQPHDGARLTTKFLCACPKLFSIVFWHMTIPTPLFEISMPGLRRFSFHPHHSLSFTAPIFHSITHLEIAGYDSKDWPFLWSAGLPSLPSLTHLALDAQPPSDLQEALLEDLPSSVRVILLRVGDLSETRRFANYPHVVCFTDEMKDATRGLPFLDVFSDDAFYIWTGKPSEEESFWIEGERLLEKKEREQVESIS